MPSGQIIIIEGTDCTGKSTLAHALADWAGSRTAVFHAGPPQNKSFLNEYVLPLVIASDGWTCICDRWHLGEPVWSNIFGRKPILTREQLHIVEKRLQAFNVSILPVYLYRDSEDIILEMQARGEDAVDVDRTLRALDEFNKAMQYSYFYWQRYTLPEAMAELTTAREVS